MQPHRNRGRPLPSGITVEEDAEAVFRTAIAAGGLSAGAGGGGVLSAERGERNWAGDYFYMFHDRDGAAWFKHRLSRTHVTMTAQRSGNAA